MTKCKGKDCPNVPPPSNSNRPRLWCSEECRRLNRPKSSGQSTANPSPQPDVSPLADAHVRLGLIAWLAPRPELPESLVAAALALASQVDARPGEAKLWAAYQRALASLLLADAERERENQRHVFDFQAAFAVRDVAEKYRGERYRAAMDKGDEQEACRWAKLVPVGCARGEHAWYRWPAGYEACADCAIDRAEIAA